MDLKSIKKKATVKDGRKTRRGSRKPLPRKAEQKQAITAITKQVQKSSKMQIPPTAKQSNGKVVLCDACHAMFNDEMKYPGDEEDKARKCHQLTRNSMQAAIKAGCEFCGISWELWQIMPRGREFQLDEEQTFSTYLLWDGSVWLEIIDRDDGSGNMTHSAITFDLHPTSDPVHTQSCECRGYSRPNSLGEPSRTLEGSLLQISSWLKECEREHTCTSFLTRPDALFSMPSRVLDISHPDGMDYFRVDSPPIAPYATLSHCWGQIEERKPPRLTLANQSSSTERTPIASLPRTFQDAILVVKYIGVRYLWIDSLCIIQDDVADWQKESGRMTKTYRNAIVNIQAEAAPDCHAGLFVRRDDERTKVRPFTGVGIAGSPSQSILVPQYYREMNEDNPLRKRAWTFQERLLAPRQISFGCHQVMWKCSRLAACEVFSSGYPSHYFEELQSLDPALLECINSNHSMGGFSKGLWYQLVAAYTKCALTREEDKLVAIQGIARLLKSISNDDYVAGLWRRSLALDLLWTANLGFSEPAHLSTYRPEDYRAPTWSWASVEGPISWWLFRPSWWSFLENLIQILDVSIIPEGAGEPGQAPDNTGQIKMGQICLKGRLRSTKGGKFLDFGFGTCLYAEDSEEEKTECSIDDVRQWRRDQEYFLLTICRCSYDRGLQNYQYQGLVLAPDTRCPTTFSRIGSFFRVMDKDDSIFNDIMAQEEQVITLI